MVNSTSIPLIVYQIYVCTYSHIPEEPKSKFANKNECFSNLDLPRTHCPLVFLFVVFGICKICYTLATIRSCCCCYSCCCCCTRFSTNWLLIYAHKNTENSQKIFEKQFLIKFMFDIFFFYFLFGFSDFRKKITPAYIRNTVRIGSTSTHAYTRSHEHAHTHTNTRTLTQTQKKVFVQKLLNVQLFVQYR